MRTGCRAALQLRSCHLPLPPNGLCMPASKERVARWHLRCSALSRCSVHGSRADRPVARSSARSMDRL
eukprot:988119-Prymnesium_polylepis.1